MCTGIPFFQVGYGIIMVSDVSTPSTLGPVFGYRKIWREDTKQLYYILTLEVKIHIYIYRYNVNIIQDYLFLSACFGGGGIIKHLDQHSTQSFVYLQLDPDLYLNFIGI